MPTAAAGRPQTAVTDKYSQAGCVVLAIGNKELDKAWGSADSSAQPAAFKANAPTSKVSVHDLDMMRALSIAARLAL